MSNATSTDPNSGWVENTPLTVGETESRAALAQTDLLPLLGEFAHRMRLLPSARIVWQSLTVEQRNSVGVDLWPVYHSVGTLGIWMRLHGHDNRYRALVEFAEEYGHFPRSILRKLRVAIGDPRAENLTTTTASNPILPRWDPAGRQLLYGGLCARRVRVCKTPTTTQRILAAFEEAGWPQEIPYPTVLRGAANPHKPIHDLNRNLRIIEFHTGRRGEEPTIYWSRREP